jgi:tryptophan synthase alpha chain
MIKIEVKPIVATRIGEKFARLKAQNKKALVTFVTAGDPTREITVPLMHAMVKSGVDVIELGVPFSDPMAEGPVIQRSSERALALGVGMADVFAYVAEFRKTDSVTPIVLMGYANPIERMGLKVFGDRAKAAGVDGVIVVDYPPEESHELLETMDAVGIDVVYLLSPTSTPNRIEMVANVGRGYIYYVSLKGVTGAANIDTAEVAAAVAKIKAKTDLPIGVGFGIRDGETARRVSDVADAVIIGSRIIQEMEKSSPDAAIKNVQTLLQDIRAAMDA